jgi:hypothetical protein
LLQQNTNDMKENPIMNLEEMEAVEREMRMLK